MRWLPLFLVFVFSACVTPQREVTAIRPCNSIEKGWPIHPEHFYDGEIHLVPSFTNALDGFRESNAMVGYVVVFVKPRSVYQNMGFQSGDVIVGMDKLQFDKPVPPETFKRIKEHKYETLKVDHCLPIEGSKK